MSSARGNSNRNRPQKYQNKTAFKNDLHDTSNKTKFINSLEITGVCKRCKDILEWKIKYKKYKPLTAPRKCVDCEQKVIKHAYHMLCGKCAIEKQVCPKCCKPKDDDIVETVSDSKNDRETNIKSLLKGLPERKRRTILRQINQSGQEEITPEIKAQVDEILLKIDKFDLEDEFLE